MLRRAEVVGTSCKRSDNAVLGGVLGVEVVVRWLPVDRSGLVRWIRTSRKGKGAVWRGPGCFMVKLMYSVRELRKER